MRRHLAVASISIAMLCLPSGARAAHWIWTCQAASAGGGSSGDGATRKDAEDQALGNCAARSARFSECRIFKCSRARVR